MMSGVRGKQNDNCIYVAVLNHASDPVIVMFKNRKGGGYEKGEDIRGSDNGG